MNELDQPIRVLSGIGPKLEEKLAKCHLHQVKDLLFHLPNRYQDKTRVTPLADVRDGSHVIIYGQIISAQLVYGKRPYLKVVLDDNTGIIDLKFFHFNASQRKKFSEFSMMRCFGQVRAFGRQLSMIHPEYQLSNIEDICELEETLSPIYPTTEGLGQNKIRNLVNQALDKVTQGLDKYELLPQSVLQQFDFPSLAQSLRFIHHPPPDVTVDSLENAKHPALERLIIEELVAHYLCMQMLKKTAQSIPATPIINSGRLLGRFVSQLDFCLTQAQQRVTDEILSSMAQDYPMQRLVQGDVGSGKTVVAAMSAVVAVDSGYQVAVMAPTEILAEQHYCNFSLWANRLDISVALLVGKMTKRQRQQQYQCIASGNVDIIIGTHALFQDDVRFKNLALIIIDEQHRFGVEQRLRLLDKGKHNQSVPHQLLMSATPIPRTLAMIMYADLELSTIDELPAGRTPIKTVVMSNDKRHRVIERLRVAFDEGRQAYWVCTLIEESEQLACEAAQDIAQTLSLALSEYKVGLIHGRMKPTEKNELMQAFKQGQLHLLVATTVIEVGVDVPNATVMVIENPERLGLSQLHQLRGRVGRGSHASFCILLYKPPLNSTSKQRLASIRETQDGFKIAQKDLQLRGPGEILGTRQTGKLVFRLAQLERDQYLLPKIPKIVASIERECPELIPKLIQRWFDEKLQYRHS